MFDAHSVTLFRWSARVALGIPLAGLGFLIGGNTTGSPVLALAGSVLAALLVVFALDRAAERVAIRLRSERLPWMSCAFALAGAWLVTAALALAGAQFSAVDASGVGPYAVWAAVSATTGLIAGAVALVVAVIAWRRSVTSGDSAVGAH